MLKTKFLTIYFLMCSGLLFIVNATVPTPPADISAKVDWIWTNQIQTIVTNNTNTFIDQLYATSDQGKFQVCIRWDSDENVTAAKRDCIEKMLQFHMGQWTTWLKGYDGWPWDTIPLRISGWAARTAADLEWTSAENNNVPNYIGDVSFESAPQCVQTCGRFFHQDKAYKYPSCPGGITNHYDFSSWHSEGYANGCGSDWGQRTNSTTTLNSCAGQMIIISHEMGHGFGLPDFYDFTVPGGNPACVMVSGTASSPQPYDYWMLRRTYSELKKMSGRLPTVTSVKKDVSPTNVAAQENVYFSVTTQQGFLKIIPRAKVNQPLQINLFDLSGRLTLSEKRQDGIQYPVELGLLKGLRGGMYLVKIVGKDFNEVHRIGIAN